MKKIIVLFSLLWLFVCQFAAADDNRRLSELEDKAYRATTADSSLFYVDQLINEAKASGNNEYLCKGYLKMVINAYNNLDKDEVGKWVEQLTPLAEKEKLYDILFRAKHCLIDLTLMNEELEKGENEARKMLYDATQMNNNFGIVLAHLCISHAYSLSYRSDLAAEELEKGYSISSKMDNLNLNMEILNGLVGVYRTLQDGQNELKYLLLQERSLKDYVSKNPSDRELFKPDFMIVYGLLTSYFVSEKDTKTAKRYIDLAQEYFSENYAEIYKLFYYKARMSYFSIAKDYDSVLVTIDKLLKINDGVFNPDYNALLFYKADVMRTIGKLPEAVTLFQQGFQLDESLHVAILNKQIRELEDVNETEKLLLEQKRIQNQEQRTIFVVILFVLIMVVCYAFYSWRVKHKLSKAEQEMRVMSKQMTAANIAKDRFMSNITQTIKDPLDVIVGGAERLVKNENLSEKQNKELSDQIKITSEKLMVLINNILDLSRLEAGMMKFQKENIPLVSYLVEMISSKSSLTVSVEEDVVSKYWAEIDKKRMTEVIESVLVSDQPNPKVTIAIQNSNSVEIVVCGTQLSVDQVSQDTIIRNEINRMFILCFQGNYRVENQTITITVPVSFVG